jgi:hypothetical protein
MDYTYIYSFANILIVIGLVSYGLFHKTSGFWLIAIFVYLSTQGIGAVFAALIDDGRRTSYEFHNIEADYITKMVSILFILCCGMGILNNLIYQRYDSRELRLGKIVAAMSLPFAFVALYAGYARPDASVNSTNIKEIVVSCLILPMSLFFFSYAQRVRECLEGDSSIVNWMFLILIINSLVAFLEIQEDVTYSGTQHYFGYVARASGAMFNPNVLGFWVAMVALAGSLLYHIKKINLWQICLIMVVVVGLLIASSSRSGLILTLIGLGSVSALLYSRRASLCLNTFDPLLPLFAFLICSVLYKILFLFIGDSGWRFGSVMAINFQRLEYLFNDLSSVVINRFFAFVQEYFSIQQPASFPDSGATMLNSKLIESVSGRMVMEQTTDNSYLFVYITTGVLGLAIWIFMWLVGFFVSSRRYFYCPSVRNAYALAGLVFCFTSGFFLRSAQVIPVSIFLSFIIAMCLWVFNFENLERRSCVK